MQKTNYFVPPRWQSEQQRIIYCMRSDFGNLLLVQKSSNASMLYCTYTSKMQSRQSNIPACSTLKKSLFRPHKEIFIGVVCVISYVIGFSCISRVSTKPWYLIHGLNYFMMISLVARNQQLEISSPYNLLHITERTTADKGALLRDFLLQSSEAIFKRETLEWDPMLELTLASPYLIVDSKVQPSTPTTTNADECFPFCKPIGIGRLPGKEKGGS